MACFKRNFIISLILSFLLFLGGPVQAAQESDGPVVKTKKTIHKKIKKRNQNVPSERKSTKSLPKLKKRRPRSCPESQFIVLKKKTAFLKRPYLLRLLQRVVPFRT